ncbi:MAG: D-aminoacylase, partial [Armatimonadetes bacterium]|nr:D-aminoacylase [Armatimonadota bacterium]
MPEPPAEGQRSILIRGALIFDGTGGEPFHGDILVRGDRVISVGEKIRAEADALINGDGLAATPGFIAIHGHSDLVLLADPRGLSK